MNQLILGWLRDKMDHNLAGLLKVREAISAALQTPGCENGKELIKEYDRWKEANAALVILMGDFLDHGVSSSFVNAVLNHAGSDNKPLSLLSRSLISHLVLSKR